ncbi:hypothetical protein [Trichormus sp. NMC-1]|nr:hypothetical protein [Trichormus sp. NMC-1]
MTNIHLQEVPTQQQPNTVPYLGLVCITSDQQVRFRNLGMFMVVRNNK